MPLLARFVTSSLALEIAYEALMDVATSEEHVDLACEVLDTLQLPPPDHSVRLTTFFLFTTFCLFVHLHCYFYN